MGPLSRRHFLGLGAAGSFVGLFGCQGGTPSILGYQLGTEALYDKNIQSVFVHTFYCRTLETGPYRGMETSLTQEVVRAIGATTPFKVVSDPGRADTELIGTIVGITKNSMNTTQQNTVREGQLVIAVDVVWRDLRTGKILSAPKKKGNQYAAPALPTPGVGEVFPPQFDQDVAQPPDVAKTPKVDPVRIQGTGRWLMEFGETNATAEQMAIHNVAMAIVSMMEKPWIKRQ